MPGHACKLLFPPRRPRQKHRQPGQQQETSICRHRNTGESSNKNKNKRRSPSNPGITLKKKNQKSPALVMMTTVEENYRETRPEWSNIVFVLGGPGSGKGTNCAKLAKEFNYVHFAAGDLLRNEITKGTETGKMIDTYIREGEIVPMEVTIGLLKDAMIASPHADGFLIDGFPRKMDQADAFEEHVAKGKFVLFFDCPANILEQRLLDRGKTSGRTDDNIDTIRKRFKTFVETSMPVVEKFGKQKRLVKIDSSRPLDQVYADARKSFLS